MHALALHAGVVTALVAAVVDAVIAAMVAAVTAVVFACATRPAPAFAPALPASPSALMRASIAVCWSRGLLAGYE